SVEVGADGFIRVVGLDGVIRAAGGNIREEPGRSLKGAKLFELVEKQPAGWFYTESRFKDQVPRLLVWRALKEYPLVVTVGRSTREIFAAVSAKRRSYNIIAGLLTLLILAAVAHSVHGGLRLEHASEEVRRQNARFQAALDNMPHGISMYDAQGGFVVSNSRYLEMYGIPPERARLGTPLAELLAARMALEGWHGDPAAIAREIMAYLADGGPVVRHARLKDGRTVSIINQPMADGGFVATHQDITAQQRAERELRSTKNFLDTIIENVPMPLVVKAPQTQKFTFVNQAYEEFIGRPRAELIGRTLYDIYPGEIAERIALLDDAAVEAMRTGAGVIKAEVPAVTARGARMINSIRLV